MSLSIFFLIEQTSLYLPLMLGAFISLSLMKLPNLSLEAAFVTGAVFSAKLLPLVTAQFNTYFAIFCVLCAAMAGGAIVGFCLSLLIIRGSIPVLLSNIMSISIFFGANLFLLGSAHVTLSGISNPLSDGIVARYPECVSVACISFFVLLCIAFLLSCQLGYSFAIYGQNPMFFKNYNIDIDYVLLVGLVISNALAGLSGYLISQTSGFVDIQSGSGLALLCVTTLMLGKIFTTRNGYNSVLQPCLGLVFYIILQQVLLKLGFNLKYFMVVQAITVIFVVLCHHYYYGTKKDYLTVDSLGV